jgi:hypothetical protein
VEASEEADNAEYEGQIGGLIDDYEKAQNVLFTDVVNPDKLTVATGHLYIDKDLDRPEVESTKEILERLGIPDDVVTGLEAAIVQMRADISTCRAGNNADQCIKDIGDVDFGLSDEHRDLLRDDDISKKEEVIRGKIPAFDTLPVALKVQLVQSTYRGGITGSSNTIEFINQGKWKEAAEEFLDHTKYKEYKASGTFTGIVNRMEDLEEALLNMVEQDDFALGSNWVRHNENLGYKGPGSRIRGKSDTVRDDYDTGNRS